MPLDLSKNPEKGKEYQTLLWATYGVKRALERLKGDGASYYDAVEAAFWIGAAAEAADEKQDPFFSAFYFIANNGRHSAMVAFQGVHRDSGPMIWDDVNQWLHDDALDPTRNPKSRALDYNNKLAGKEVIPTVARAEQRLLDLHSEANMTLPDNAVQRLDPKTGELTISKAVQLDRLLDE